MSFPPLRPSSQNFNTSGESTPSSSGSTRPRQSAWLPTQPTSRRDLAPLTTSALNSSDPSLRRLESATSPASITHANSTPFGQTFSSVLSSSSKSISSRVTSSGPSSSSSASTFAAPLQTGSQQLPASQLLSSSRPRTITSLSASNLASSAVGSSTASQGGGGGSSGGGGPPRSGAFSPSFSSYPINSPTSTNFERLASSIPGASAAASGQSSVSKIVVTQVFLLLGSITEKEGKAKWDSQAEAIRKLVESHGMEVFAKYFRRLVTGNSPQIFPGTNRNVENLGNYPLLVLEVEKAAHDPERAKMVAEVIDTSEGDIFRDFDLSTFVNHFRLNSVSKTTLIAPFTQANKPDLRTKASSILSQCLSSLLRGFASSDDAGVDITPAILAATVFHLLCSLPGTTQDSSEKRQVRATIKARFADEDLPVPSEIRSAMSLATFFESPQEFLKDLMQRGPSVTISLESSKDFLKQHSKSGLDEDLAAYAILYTILSPDAEHFRTNNLVAGLRDIFPDAAHWSKIVRGFDCEDLILSQEQFLELYHAFYPIAQELPDFDIQALWGGRWQNVSTQLSFAVNLASLPSSQLDASTIPKVRQAYDPTELSDGPEDVLPLAEAAARDPMISIDAVVTIADAFWGGTGTIPESEILNARSVVNDKLTYFVCSAAGIPKPWGAMQLNFFSRMVENCLRKAQADYKYILHCMWKQDKNWLATCLIEAHSSDPLNLPLLLEHAQEHNWLEELCTLMNGFAIDMAALAHRKGLIDLHEWAQEKADRSPSGDFSGALAKFLGIKAQDEMRTLRREQPAARTVTLAMKTVHVILEILEQHMSDRREELNEIERRCMQAYPRLCNYGEGFDEIIESNGVESHALPQSADAEMQNYFKRMYNGELEVRHIIEGLRECKTSEDPSKQDLFACMIHGLFDEFVCFGEYPLGPLATTAVLFGGIINYRLINHFALNVALQMVLESVRDHSPESPMYKFGLQALLHFLNRFAEWPDFCQQLVQIPGLQGTDPYGRAQDILREQRNEHNGDTNGVEPIVNGQSMTNGNVEDMITADALVPQFRSVNADSSPQGERFEDPEETIQDKVLFALNNVSEQNLKVKLADITEALSPQHYQWFASYLVEQRARVQPNYQQLYLELLDLFNDRSLWAGVLRETFVCVRKTLNAESTMRLPAERTHLRNLGTWLGSLTLARERPIKHKNIAFKELLIEGWETSRLILVIPFTCEVLAQGAKSVLFRPPNPWIMEIIAMLLELYDLPDLKIQQKFAIEVLLSTFELPKNGEGLERANELKKRQQMYEVSGADGTASEGLDAFDEMPIGSLNKSLRSIAIAPPEIPNLEDQIVLPPASSGPINQAQLRAIVQVAVQHAITEIVVPVVERSVTIATIATKDLITKDFAQEADEDKLRESFEQMAKSLAGSLASVTSKEPLRASMSNNIRMGAADMPDALPEGSVLMCVNDNLDLACRFVEKSAEERAIAESEPLIEQELSKRRQHKAEFPTEPYRDPISSHWSTYIPDPYKLLPGGLNQQQLDIYQNFTDQPRVIAAHGATASTDSGKQIPDVLQEPGFPGIPNLSTPQEQPAVSRQPQPQQAHSRLIPPNDTRPSSQLNGYMDADTLQDHMHELLEEIIRLAKDTSEQRLSDLPRDHPIIGILTRLLNIVRGSANQETFVVQTANMICEELYQLTSRLEAESFVQLLKHVCQYSALTSTKVVWFLRTSPEDRLLNAQLTAVLLEANLLDFSVVDAVLARGIHEKRVEVLEVFAILLDALLFGDEPIALRADFASSLGGLGQWYSDEPDFEPVKALSSKLKAAGIPDPRDQPASQPVLAKQHQVNYVYSEWLTIFNRSENSEATLVAFVAQLNQRQMLRSTEDILFFLRLTIDLSVEAMEKTDLSDPNIDPHEAHFSLDALAKLIVCVVKNQTESNGKKGNGKAAYMKSVLALIVLVLNNHHVMNGEQFNQRAFFRLFSSIFYSWHESMRGGDRRQDKAMIITFAESLLMLSPQTFPGFTYGWLSLVSHRIFMPALLKIADKEGSDLYAKLMEIMLAFASDLYIAGPSANVSKEIYRGVLRVLLILHHDFPEFLADNHFRLCNTIPSKFTQLRNLVLSAFPSSILELPDPFSHGLKVDRLDDIKKAPVIESDYITPLARGNVQKMIDTALADPGNSHDAVRRIAAEVSPSEAATNDTTVLHAIVLYIGQSAVSCIPDGYGNGSSLSNNSSHVKMLGRLAKELNPEARYHFLSSIVNQLRYPNSHTHFFSHALLEIFNPHETDARDSDVRQQITRVLLERLIVHRPHPWGLIITLLELLKNPAYNFWELPFIKAAPEIAKLFDALFNHINQTSRALN